ncbi:lipopolysaccharide export system permease protein [Pontibacter ummariensis]|uniref:Lipopolysaccharide export system permease protein n=1 Tax=Pontibacter ummariensis TaxID=1610492 RepID=A0A239EFR4_9BACT|nr:LptF/LptG family permease [Pontibacter ummariensis]PRY13206.1 lipopolysaccharide export system permease protein [Pontibacter ummariensis]SNS42744.1 lipopolysaccharide export system permease protein [Pontibacter ummariensis]
MKLLDKYILKKFLTTYVFTVLILVAVILVIDFTEKNDDFIKTNPSVSEILFDYYLNLIPFYANMLSPITVFIATVFVTAKLASHTEIVAMLSSGISFRRFLVPYLMGSSLIAILIFLFIGWVIPNANKESVAFQVKYIKSPFTYDGRNIHIKIAPETYVYMESYNNTAHVGYNFALETIEGTKLKQKLTSNNISWNKELEKWHVDKYVLRTFNGEKETIYKGEALDTALNMLPKDFESTYKLETTLTLTQLNDYIQEKRERGADDIETYLIEKYERLSYPFAIIILTVIGVIVSARKARGGVGFQIALGFFLAFIFIIFVITSRSLAQVGDIPPQIAAWVPTIVFTGIGFLLYRYVPR